MKLTFNADRVTVRERESDNSYKVIFNCGEYVQNEVVKLMALPKDVNLKVTVEAND